jgi:glutathione S-transferase
VSEYVLYYSPDSANLVVRVALEECGVSYAARLVDRSVGQQRSPDYLELNPQGLIPVLVDGDVVIFETAAILLYLVDRHEGLGPRRVMSARADLYRWLFFLSNTLHADLRVMFYSQRHVTDQSAVGTLRAGTRLRLLGHLELLDAHMGRHASGYLLESGFSVCDLYLAACCRWMMIYPADEPIPGRSLRALPRLWPFLERMEQRPAVVRACTAEWIEPPFLTAPRMPRPPVGSVTG